MQKLYEITVTDFDYLECQCPAQFDSTYRIVLHYLFY